VLHSSVEGFLHLASHKSLNLPLKLACLLLVERDASIGAITLYRGFELFAFEESVLRRSGQGQAGDYRRRESETHGGSFRGGLPLKDRSE
jgi:hypothetical protein